MPACWSGHKGCRPEAPANPCRPPEGCKGRFRHHSFYSRLQGLIGEIGRKRCLVDKSSEQWTMMSLQSQWTTSARESSRYQSDQPGQHQAPYSPLVPDGRGPQEQSSRGLAGGRRSRRYLPLHSGWLRPKLALPQGGGDRAKTSGAFKEKGAGLQTHLDS